jgi:hypothetical protein
MSSTISTGVMLGSAADISRPSRSFCACKNCLQSRHGPNNGTPLVRNLHHHITPSLHEAQEPHRLPSRMLATMSGETNSCASAGGEAAGGCHAGTCLASSLWAASC